MPQDANSIPLDDEDILDLTVVAEPGKQPDAPASQADAPPEPGAPGMDFGADLDALLDSLAPDGSITAPATAPEPAAPAEPVAAPIADQTPVTHTVDPNEEMAMPEVADIDSLLAELGADIPAASAAPEQPAPPASEPAPEVSAPPAAAPIADFDSILAQAQAADAAKAEEEAAQTTPEPTPVVEASPEPVAEAAPVASAEPEPVPAPTAPAELAVAEEALAATPPTAPETAKEADFTPESEEESLDLNELDALLDDILATAPEMSPPAAAAPESPAEPEPAPAVIPVPEQALVPPATVDPETLERLSQLEENVKSLEAALAERVRRLEETTEALGAERQSADDERHEAMTEKILRMEDTISVLETSAANQITEEAVMGLVAVKVDELTAPGSPVMDKVVAAVLDALTAEDGGHAAAIFAEQLEKMAAAAAAKVIREEIAALVAEE